MRRAASPKARDCRAIRQSNRVLSPVDQSGISPVLSQSMLAESPGKKQLRRDSKFAQKTREETVRTSGRKREQLSRVVKFGLKM